MKNLRSRALRAIPLGLGLLLGASPGFAEPVRLTPYPQKVSTRYPTNSPLIPPGLFAPATPLPVGQATATVRASDGAVWLGTTQGLLRLDFSAPARDARQFMASQRYLPDDQVVQLLADNQAGVWVRTRTGVTHIELKPMTLAKKAEHFEARIRARHDRYGLVADCGLPVAGDTKRFQPLDNDNDGLWTSIYAAAECFRYSVTGEPEALARARKAVEAMLFLEEVAGRRGFPARSFIRKGDVMPGDGEWHWTADGQYYWKGDTSSDEIVGHFFMFGIAYDLLPDPELKRRIAETTKRVMDHILDHDYCLVDLKGKPTTWGWWSPARLLQQPDERALNSLQLLSFLKTAAHITGDPRYTAEYRKVAGDWKYAEWITRVKEFRLELNYSDEELALLPFYRLFAYEQDPALLKAYRQAADAWWDNIRREANPLWTFIHLKGQPDAAVDMEAAVWTLYRTPLDTINWTVRNSPRQDIIWAPGLDRAGKRESLNLLPPDERPVMRWNANPFAIDGGDGGNSEDDGAAFLLPYWLGRYQKLLFGE